MEDPEQQQQQQQQQSPPPSGATAGAVLHGTEDEDKGAPVAAAGGKRSLPELSKEELLQLLAHIQQAQGGAAHVEGALNALVQQQQQQPPPAESGDKKKKKKKGKDDQGKKKQKEFDFSRHGTRHIALLISYDGENYAGFASQGSVVQETVEGHLLSALQKVKFIKDRAWARYSRCGRTDKGVSALRQVVGVRVRSNRAAAAPATEEEEGGGDRTQEEEGEGDEEEEVGGGEAASSQGHGTTTNQQHQGDIWAEVYDTGSEGELDYCGVLNRVLPKDIRALGWTPVPSGFSARFCASQRTYRYFFSGQGMDLARMDEAARRLVGDHDFRNLCKMDVTKTTNFRRVVHEAKIRTVATVGWTGPATRAKQQQQPEGAERQTNGDAHRQEDDGGDALALALASGSVCCLEITGQAFLWHMVRCIMAVLLLVGRGLEEPDVVDYLLDVEGACPRKPHFAMAHEAPLVLHDCHFPRLTFQYQASNLLRVWGELRQQWCAAAVKLSRIQNSMDFLCREARVTRQDVDALIASSCSTTTTTARGGGGKGQDDKGQGTRGKKRKAPGNGNVAGSGSSVDGGATEGTVATSAVTVPPLREAVVVMMTWGEALQALCEAGVVMGGEEDKKRYTPLSKREVNRALEEVVREMGGRKREVFEESKRKRDQGGGATGRDAAFFRRLQGTMTTTTTTTTGTDVKAEGGAGGRVVREEEEEEEEVLISMDTR